MMQQTRPTAELIRVAMIDLIQAPRDVLDDLPDHGFYAERQLSGLYRFVGRSGQIRSLHPALVVVWDDLDMDKVARDAAAAWGAR